jgi:hypothetical protein
MTKPSEEDLIRLAKALGEATTRCSDEERAHIKRLYEDVQKFGDEQKEKGTYIDRSAFFAAGIILHPEIENEGVRKAATEYVEMDHMFIKAYEDPEEVETAAKPVTEEAAPAQGG